MRAAQPAAREQHKREARASARARALEDAKDNPEQVEYFDNVDELVAGVATATADKLGDLGLLASK